MLLRILTLEFTWYDLCVRVFLYDYQNTSCSQNLTKVLVYAIIVHNNYKMKHVAEIPYENQLVMERQGVDHGTVTYLEKIELLQKNLLAAHTVWVNDHEVYMSLPVSCSVLGSCF